MDLENTIAGNTGNGITLFGGDDTIGHSIRGNVVFAKGRPRHRDRRQRPFPIPNDPGDANAGSNRTQNHPKLARAGWDAEY